MPSPLDGFSLRRCAEPGIGVIAAVTRARPSRGELSSDLRTHPALARSYRTRARIIIVRRRAPLSRLAGRSRRVRAAVSVPYCVKTCGGAVTRFTRPVAHGADMLLLSVAALDLLLWAGCATPSRWAGPRVGSRCTPSKKRTVRCEGRSPVIGVNARDLLTLRGTDCFAASRRANRPDVIRVAHPVCGSGSTCAYGRAGEFGVASKVCHQLRSPPAVADLVTAVISLSPKPAPSFQGRRMLGKWLNPMTACAVSLS